MKSDDGEFVRDASQQERDRRRDLDRLILSVFGSQDGPTARYIAWTVSGYQPLAFHRHSASGVGLFDIVPADVGLPDDEAYLLLNPIRNASYALKLFKSGGWLYWDDVDLDANTAAFLAEKE
jgi:hypothetical protein